MVPMAVHAATGQYFFALNSDAVSIFLDLNAEFSEFRCHCLDSVRFLCPQFLCTTYLHNPFCLCRKDAEYREFVNNPGYVFFGYFDCLKHTGSLTVKVSDRFSGYFPAIK